MTLTEDELHESFVRRAREMRVSHWSNKDIDCLLRQIDLLRQERDEAELRAQAAEIDLDKQCLAAERDGQEKGYKEAVLEYGLGERRG